MAVDYFFMLSGFGLFLSSKRPELKPKNCLTFAIDKIKKIYPSYVFSLLMGGIWLFLVTEGFAKFIFKAILFTSIDLTLLQSITGSMTFSHSINGVCWFLSCIFVCYIISPVFLKIVDSVRNKKRWIVFSFFTVLLIILLSMCLSYIDELGLVGGRIDNLWYGHPIVRCLYVMIGMLIGWLYKNTNIKSVHSLENGTIVLCVLYFLYRNTIVTIVGKNFLRPIDVMLCAFLLFVVSKGKGRIVALLSTDIMVKLGQKTMYLFLFHYPIRGIIGLLFKKYNVFGFMGEVSYFVEVLLICLTTCILVILFEKGRQKFQVVCK